MKKKVLASLSAAVLLLGAMTAFAEDEAATRYQGYAIYRDGVPASWVSGGYHAAILVEPLVTSTNTPIVHATYGSSVSKVTWDTFMNGNNTYQGVYKPSSQSINKYQRYDVYETAIQLKNCNIPYTAAKQLEYNTYGCGTYIQPWFVTAMRCDGVVEYCYEYNGVRVYGSDANWDVSRNDSTCNSVHFGNLITPKKQVDDYMTRVLPPTAFPTDDNSEP